MSENQNLELSAVKKALDIYFEGIKFLDYDQIYRVFHKEANLMTTDPEGKMVTYKSSVWKDICLNTKKNIKDLNEYKVSASIEDIDLVQDTASVRVKMRMETPGRISDFKDYYHMLKIDGNWMIVAKTYHGDHQTKQ
ncbi:MAG: nuclear transport factor 2 family protein [Candidatus Hodarchaeota archaeon]